MSKPQKLNRKKAFGTVHGHPKHRYSQDGYYFDFYGDVCGPIPGSPLHDKAAKPRPKKKVGTGVTKTVGAVKGKSDAALLAEADAGLGDLGLSAPSVPSTVQDVKKENAEALAAEERNA